MPNKIKLPSLLSSVPNSVVVFVLVMGFGALFALLAYEVFYMGESALVNEFSSNDLDKNKPVEDNATRDEYFGNNFIQIKSPRKNAAVNNSIIVSGRASVLESNIMVRIKDSNNILAESYITVESWIDKLYPFSRKIRYSKPASRNGVVEIFEKSEKDGSEINKVVIPVVFLDYKKSSPLVSNQTEFLGNGYSFKYSEDELKITADPLVDYARFSDVFENWGFEIYNLDQADNDFIPLENYRDSLCKTVIVDSYRSKLCQVDRGRYPHVTYPIDILVNTDAGRYYIGIFLSSQTVDTDEVLSVFEEVLSSFKFIKRYDIGD